MYFPKVLKNLILSDISDLMAVKSNCLKGYLEVWEETNCPRRVFSLCLCDDFFQSSSSPQI